MKKTHIAMLLVIGAAIMLLISSSDSYSRYVDFAEAAEYPGKEFQLIGILDHDQEMTYNPVQDPNYFSFFLNDKVGVQKKVVYRGAKPADFERSEDIVLTGSMNGDELGHFFTILSMAAAFLAAFSFLAAHFTKAESKRDPWYRLGKWGFFIHAFSVLAIIGILYYLITMQYWEYQYVWQHSSADLPARYRISCFWEGQEGSFLLWAFWHVVLGFVLLRNRLKWSAPVMGLLCFTQIFLSAMLIGIYFFGYKIGSSPFILMRDFTPDLPVFANAQYAQLIQDGNGLNPLLQNYWMVIHPPTLFLGFAACFVPFAFCMAAMWNNDYSKLWATNTLRWSLFAGGILGIGILMGGAWAYESLTFGGFWAWDPVENASLFPWITLLAGLHCLLAYKHTGHAVRATIFFLLISFLLVLYSTFLTRSGILGDTSVHSFTDLGMSGQLISFFALFVAISVGSMAIAWKDMPTIVKEESAYSREFWLFVGSLILFLYGAFIIWDTSWPVINKITTMEWFKVLPWLGQYADNQTAITDPITHYNRYSVWFGSVTAVLLSGVQYLRYKTKLNKRNIGLMIGSAILSIILSVVLASSLGIEMTGKYTLPFTQSKYPFLSPYFFLLIAGVMAVVMNFNYLVSVIRGKVKVSGASVAHIGFGLIMLGALISNYNQEVISLNTMGMDYGEGWDTQTKMENVYLPKDVPVQMNDYWITYTRDSVAAPDTYFAIEYEKKEKLEDEPTEEFTLWPNAQINPKMGLISNPSSKHYWDKDVFTYVRSIPNNEARDTAHVFKEFELAVGDTVFTELSGIVLEEIVPNPTHPLYIPDEGQIAAMAVLGVYRKDKRFQAEPIYYIKDRIENTIPAEVSEANLDIRFSKILPETGKIKLEVSETIPPQAYVIMSATIFPWINVLWLGSFIMGLGFIMSMIQRIGETRRLRKKATA